MVGVMPPLSDNGGMEVTMMNAKWILLAVQYLHNEATGAPEMFRWTTVRRGGGTCRPGPQTILIRPP